MRELTFLLGQRGVSSPIDAHHVSRRPYYAAERPHRLDYFQALLLTEGEARVMVDDRHFDAFPGRVILTGPGQVLAIDLSPGARRHVLCFTEQAWGQSAPRRDGSVFDPVASPLFVDLREAERRRIEHSLEAMAAELDDWDSYSAGLLDALLRETLGRLGRAAQTGCAPRATPRDSPWASCFLRAVELRFRTTRRVDDYASCMAVSPGHLHTLVRRHFGCSPKQLIDRRVAREAQRLLSLTSLPVGRVASDLGFDDVAYFCRFFRRQTGMTPTTFRRSGAES